MTLQSRLADLVAAIGADIKDLRSKVVIPLVNALPANPADGAEIYFQNLGLAADGVVWHLRYRAASASVYKWECINGGWMRATSEAQAFMSPGNLNVNTALPGSPAVTLPLAGDWEVYYGVRQWVKESADSALTGARLLVWDGVTARGQGIGFNTATQFDIRPGFTTEFPVGVPAGKALSMAYRQSNSTGANIQSTYGRLVAARPVRVG